jgi:hypothetical protein
MTLRMIDTFSAIGGFSLAARWLGNAVVPQVAMIPLARVLELAA